MIECYKVKPSAKSLWFKSMATGLFITTSSVLFITGFIYKDTWLGVHIYFVPSMSMHPTLKPGEFILLDTWAYQEIKPQLDDVVVFQQGPINEENEHWLVKRISNWPDGKLNHLEN
jgi:signal peptidase I